MERHCLRFWRPLVSLMLTFGLTVLHPLLAVAQQIFLCLLTQFIFVFTEGLMLMWLRQFSELTTLAQT